MANQRPCVAVSICVACVNRVHRLHRRIVKTSAAPLIYGERKLPPTTKWRHRVAEAEKSMSSAAMAAVRYAGKNFFLLKLSLKWQAQAVRRRVINKEKPLVARHAWRHARAAATALGVKIYLRRLKIKACASPSMLSLREQLCYSVLCARHRGGGGLLSCANNAWRRLLAGRRRRKRRSARPSMAHK